MEGGEEGRSMTEQEWQMTTDFWPMHAYLWEVARHRTRKYRLVACAICRHIFQGHPNDQIQRLLDLMETYADEPDAREALRLSFEKALNTLGEEEPILWAACDPSSPYEGYDSNEVARVVSYAQDREYKQWRPEHSQQYEEEQWEAETSQIGIQSNNIGGLFLREMFGNPFRPVSINPTWLTPIVRSLAQATYNNRILPSGTLDNARLAVLGDALEDAGCTNADILNHCRQPGEHVRGCWALDLLLGKE